MKRLQCLDGLRGALAVYVMLSHLAPFATVPAVVQRALHHGMAAVDVFFVLSGMVILRSLEGFGHRARPFLIARAFRIFPVFLAVFAFAVAVQPWALAANALPWLAPDAPARHIWGDAWPSDWAANIAAHLTMTHGLFPDGVWPFVYLGFLGAAWSLSAEWQFYAAAALLARPGQERRLIAGFLVVAALAAAWAHAAPAGWQFSRAFLPNKAQYFALGMASAMLLRDGDQRRFAAVLTAVLLLCAWQAEPGERLGKLAAPLVWTLCLWAELAPAGPLAPLSRALRSPPLLWLGAVSYCLYLVNEPAQKFLALLLAPAIGGHAALFTALWLPLALLLPAAAAWGLHRTVEQPALRWGRAIVASAAAEQRPVARAAAGA